MASQSDTSPLPLALTMGDPAGIGPDITLMAWTQRQSHALPAFLCLGDPGLYARRAELVGLDIPIETVSSPQEVQQVFTKALPVYPLNLETPVNAGEPDLSHAPQIIQAIETAVQWAIRGEVSAIVTNPINKKVLSDSGFAHPGHTEYLAHLCSGAGGDPLHPVMLLTSGDLRVVPVTVHIPLRDVPRMLSKTCIVDTVVITEQALRRHFGIESPRLAVTGLNPHAGEEGDFGNEEKEIIDPAIRHLSSKGLDIVGPLPADAAFQERNRARYDAFIAMYHDQALIPVKTLAFDQTVNVTLGLPITRTSPDHGTAYDLAGTGRANPGSMIESLKLAARLSQRELQTA